MFFIILAAAICMADLGIKRYIDRQGDEKNKPAAGGHILITRFYNKGAMLGFLKGNFKLLMGVACISFGVLCGLFIAAMRHRENCFIRTGLALMIGGAASNMYDRMMKGRVTDYFRIHIKGCERLEKVVFNIGDMGVFAGTVLIAAGTCLKK